MIDENLCRADLSASERAQQTARRKAIYEELHPETAHGGDHKSSRKVCDLNEAERFTASTAAVTGKSERIVQLDAERGKKISDHALQKVRGTTGRNLLPTAALTRPPRVERDDVSARRAVD